MSSPTNFLPTDLIVVVSSANFELTRVDEPKAEPVTAVISASGGNYFLYMCVSLY
jgi:hypothetical protein